jgi:glycosyltransferase involved in cell wall biosynthesis
MARTGGGFTYLVNLVPHLTALGTDRRFRLLLRSERLRAAIPASENLEVELLPEAGLAGRLRFTYREVARIAAAWRADVYLAAGDVAPLRAPCPTIASFRNPNVFTRLDQQWYWYQVFRLGALRRLSRLTARRCDRVLFVSDDSARWIGESIQLPESKRVVIHHGVEAERFSSPPGSPVRPGPYVLSVSSIYRYKNFVRLIEAFAELAARRDDPLDLVIVGDDRDPDYSRKMEDARRSTGELAERIHIVGEVPYAQIPAWYAGAACFAFPSYLETFGHPLLEAMAAGLPIVAGDIAVSREVAGDAACYADPHDASALARTLERVLSDGDLREKLRERGRNRVAAFRWEDSARRHLELFDELADERTA